MKIREPVVVNGGRRLSSWCAPLGRSVSTVRRPVIDRVRANNRAALTSTSIHSVRPPPSPRPLHVCTSVITRKRGSCEALQLEAARRRASLYPL